VSKLKHERKRNNARAWYTRPGNPQEVAFKAGALEVLKPAKNGLTRFKQFYSYTRANREWYMSGKQWGRQQKNAGVDLKSETDLAQKNPGLDVPRYNVAHSGFRSGIDA
jgi:hypothetical protein